MINPSSPIPSHRSPIAGRRTPTLSDRTRAASERASGGAQLPAVQSKAQPNAPKAKASRETSYVIPEPSNPEEHASLMKVILGPTDKPVEPAAIPDAAPAPSKAPTLGERAPVAAPHRPELAKRFNDVALDLQPAKVTRPILHIVASSSGTLPAIARPLEAASKSGGVNTAAPKDAPPTKTTVDPAQELQEYYAEDPEGLTMAYCEKCGGPCIPIETPEGWRSKCCNSNMSGPDGGAFRAATIRNARERLLSTKDVSVQENHKSDYRGLWFNPVTKKWRAIIFIQDLTIYLGEYASEIIAAKVYDNACFYLHREFFSSPRALNFDSHYSGKVIPPIFRSTERAASRLRQRQLQPPVAGSHDFDVGKLRRELKGTKEEAKT